MAVARGSAPAQELAIERHRPIDDDPARVAGSRFRERSRRWGRRAAVATGLAIVLHVVGLVAIVVLGPRLSPSALPSLIRAPMAARETQPVDEEPLQVESLLDELSAPVQETEEEKARKKEEEKKDPDGQVVDVARPTVEQRPEDSRFLAEYDTKVQKETRGPSGSGQAGAPLVPTLPVPPLPPPQPPKEKPAKPTPQPPGATAPKVVALGGPLGTKLPGPAGTETEVKTAGPDGEQPHPAGEGTLQPGERPGGVAPPQTGPRPPINLLPTPQQLNSALGKGGGSPDYLEDMDDGDSTGLNARRWKFAAFFNRMKSAVRDEWHPDEHLQRNDPTGNIYGAKERVTVLKVALNLKGRVDSVSVLRSSGVEFLDDEAMSAFRRAQPFDNTPEPLAGPDGIVRFNFAFIVQLSGRTSFRVFKSDQ